MQDETDLTSTYFIEDVIIIVLHISTVYGTVYNIHIIITARPQDPVPGPCGLELRAGGLARRP